MSGIGVVEQWIGRLTDPNIGGLIMSRWLRHRQGTRHRGSWGLLCSFGGLWAPGGARRPLTGLLPASASAWA